MLTLIGAFVSPKQFYFSYLTAFWYWTVISLGGVFWMFIQFVTGAAASATVRRIMENIAAGVPYAALLFVPVALGVHQLYTWADPVLAQHDPVFLDRGLYFNPTVFVIRSFILAGDPVCFCLEGLSARDAYGSNQIDRGGPRRVEVRREMGRTRPGGLISDFHRVCLGMDHVA